MLRKSLRAAVWGILSVNAIPALAQHTLPPATAAESSAYVRPAAHEMPIAKPNFSTDSQVVDPRKLSPPSPTHDTETPKSNSIIPRLAIPQGSMSTAFAALAFVVGVFLFIMSLIKRNLPPSLQLLPTDAATIVGRMQLTGKQFAHLIKLGDKLALVSISPSRIDTITEVTDPDQVARLLAICGPDWTATATIKQDYDQILRQLSAESDRRNTLSASGMGLSSRGGHGLA